MKQNSTKILVGLIAIIIVVGIIMIFTKGLAYELKYQDVKKLEITLGKEYNARFDDYWKDAEKRMKERGVKEYLEKQNSKT